VAVYGVEFLNGHFFYASTVAVRRMMVYLSYGFSLRVSFSFQQVDDTLFEVALHNDFSIFGTSAHSTFTFQQFAQFFQVIVGAHETGDKSDDFAAPVLAHAGVVVQGRG